MKVRELSAAVAELDQALTYYGRIESRLVRALLKDVQAAKQSIVRFPLRSGLPRPAGSAESTAAARSTAPPRG